MLENFPVTKYSEYPQLLLKKNIVNILNILDMLENSPVTKYCEYPQPLYKTRRDERYFRTKEPNIKGQCSLDSQT